MENKPKWTISVEKIETLKAVYSYALSDNPEEDAWEEISSWARENGLLTQESGSRVFGRNTYPTDNPEPHGYEFYVTVKNPVKPKKGLINGEIPGRSYAVLRTTSFKEMTDAWENLWKWVEASEYEFIGWKKGEHGWVNGYEELANPNNYNSPFSGGFNLWIPLKEGK